MPQKLLQKKKKVMLNLDQALRRKRKGGRAEITDLSALVIYISLSLPYSLLLSKKEQMEE